MTRRRQRETEKNAGEFRSDEAQAAIERTEEQVVGEKENQDDEELERFVARIRRNPRYAELMKQKITLKTTGVDIPLVDATALLARLRDMLERKPDQFATLVALVKPSGARSPAEAISPRALAILKKHGAVTPDGSPEKRMAAILDAAYVETAEGVILRNPIIYPSKEFVGELNRLEGEFPARLGRALLEEIKEDRHKKPGQDGGPSR
jgi:hypothetical protein